MKGDDPEIDTTQTLKSFDRRLALLEKIPKTFTDRLSNRSFHANFGMASFLMVSKYGSCKTQESEKVNIR